MKRLAQGGVNHQSLANTYSLLLRVSLEFSHDSIYTTSLSSDKSVLVTQNGCSPGDHGGPGGYRGRVGYNCEGRSGEGGRAKRRGCPTCYHCWEGGDV